MAHNEFDFQARWKGKLPTKEREILKELVRRLSAAADVEVKVGSQRSRLSARFDRNKLMESARASIGAVGALMAADEDVRAGGGVEAVSELLSAPADSRGGELQRSYSQLLLREWTGAAAQALQALVPDAGGLKIELGKDARACPSAPVRIPEKADDGEAVRPEVGTEIA